MNYIDLLKNLGIFGIIIVGCVFILRSAVRIIFMKDLEKFKADLSIEAIQFRIRYERLHSERAEVIKEVYKMISRTYRNLDSYIIKISASSREEIGKKTADEANLLVNYYEENRIFFEEELIKDIDVLIENFRKIWSLLESARITARIEGGGEFSINYGQLLEAKKELDEKIPKIKKLIENKFREIIGIEGKKKVPGAVI